MTGPSRFASRTTRCCYAQFAGFRGRLVGNVTTAKRSRARNSPESVVSSEPFSARHQFQGLAFHYPAQHLLFPEPPFPARGSRHWQDCGCALCLAQSAEPHDMMEFRPRCSRCRWISARPSFSWAPRVTRTKRRRTSPAARSHRQKPCQSRTRAFGLVLLRWSMSTNWGRTGHHGGRRQAGPLTGADPGTAERGPVARHQPLYR